MTGSAVYRFTASKHLDDIWIRRFDGFEIERSVHEQYGPVTLLTGPVRDQAALFGTVSLFRQLGIELIEIRRMDKT